MNTVLTIASGQSVSTPLTMGDQAHLAGLIFPTGFPTAAIGFEGSVLGANWFPITDEKGVAIAVTPAPLTLVTLPPTLLLGAPWLRLKLPANAAAAYSVDAVVRVY